MATLSTTAVEVKCSGCSAQFTFEPSVVAGQCPFCSTSIVAQPQSANPIVTPKAVLAFQVNRRTARETIHKWLGNQWFAPNGLQQIAQQESIQGVYLPFWTYDCQTHSRYTGERGIHYTETETYTETNESGQRETKTREVQHTRWSPASGQVSRFFDDVLVAATEAIGGKGLDSLAPWNLTNLVSYEPSYLSGFKAQRYQISMKEGFEQAKAQITSQIRQDVERDIGGDEQRVDSISTSYSNITFKHILLPVWITAYQFNNRQYQVMVNAQTGRVIGDRPLSVFKVALTAMMAIIALIIVIMIAFR